MVTIEQVRAVVSELPRAYEAIVRDRVKFRVGRIVFVAFSRDETIMGFGFPKEERNALIASDPEKFLPPSRADERYQWVQARLAALDEDEMRELVTDAWRMCVPKKVAAEYENRLAELAERTVQHDPRRRGTRRQGLAEGRDDLGQAGQRLGVGEVG